MKPTTQDPDELLTVAQVREILGISDSTVSRLFHDGLLVYERPSPRTTRVRRSELVTYQREQALRVAENELNRSMGRTVGALRLIQRQADNITSLRGRAANDMYARLLGALVLGETTPDEVVKALRELVAGHGDLESEAEL